MLKAVLLATEECSMDGRWGAVSEGAPHAVNVMRQILGHNDANSWHAPMPAKQTQHPKVTFFFL